MFDAYVSQGQLGAASVAAMGRADPALLLGATVLGGAISLLTTYLMARRGEKAAGRIAARVLDDELGAAEEMIETALLHGTWWPGAVALRAEGWSEHRSSLALLVAAGLAVLHELMAAEVEAVVGPKGKHDP